MGIIVTKDEDKKSELTRRINADLVERSRRKSSQSGKRRNPDFVEDSDFSEDTKGTGRFSWIWFILVGLALISLVIIVMP
ncbi:MAG: hypothetical protein Q4F60_02335 [Candidatus Saccharibacteria bacterium]|nr:hypothetical protein [Candidatus Saccharibacteria bacterium]